MRVLQVTLSSTCRALRSLTDDKVYWEVQWRRDFRGQAFPSGRSSAGPMRSAAQGVLLQMVGGVHPGTIQTGLQAVQGAIRGNNATQGVDTRNPIMDQVIPPPPPTVAGQLQLYRDASTAGQAAAARDFRALYVEEVQQRAAQRRAWEADKARCREELGELRCAACVSGPLEAFVHYVPAVCMVTGLFILLMLTAAQLEGDLGMGADGWWVVGGFALGMVGSVWLGLCLSCTVLLSDPGSDLVASACCCCRERRWCRWLRQSVRDSLPGSVVSSFMSEERGEDYYGLHGNQWAACGVLNVVPLLSMLGIVLVTLKTSGVVGGEMPWSVALLPWMLASFNSTCMAAAAAENDEDAFLSCIGVGRFINPDVVAVSCGPSCLQFTFWLLAGLWADGAMEGSACLVPIPFFILFGCSALAGICGAGAASCAAGVERFEYGWAQGLCILLCGVPLSVGMAAAGFAMWIMPAVQACTAIDADWDPSEAGFPGQSNWYVVFAGWLLITALAVFPALGLLYVALSEAETPFAPAGFFPGCQMCRCCRRGWGASPFEERIQTAEMRLESGPPPRTARPPSLEEGLVDRVVDLV